MPFRHILATTDFSEGADAAVRVAARWAARVGAELSVVHVYDPAPPALGLIPEARGVALAEARKEQAVALMDELRPLLGAAARFEALPSGSAVAAICDYAREQHCDLVVVGTHGRTGLSRMLMGSVAEQVVREAPCTVLAVRPGVDMETFPTHVMVCTDMSTASETGLDLGAGVAKAFAAQVTLAHVHEAAWFDTLADPDHPGRLRDALKARLTAIRAEHFDESTRAAFLRGNNAPEAITRGAGQEGNDLIVLATHGHTGLRRWVIGSVAERVARHANCPVLVARVAPQHVMD